MTRGKVNATLEALREISGGVLFVALLGVLMWLFAVATPDQASAACDAVRVELGMED